MVPHVSFVGCSCFRTGMISDDHFEDLYDSEDVDDASVTARGGSAAAVKVCLPVLCCWLVPA